MLPDGFCDGSDGFHRRHRLRRQDDGRQGRGLNRVPRRVGGQDKSGDTGKRAGRPIGGAHCLAHRIGRLHASHPVRHRPGKALDVAGQGSIVLQVIGGVVSDDVDDRAMGAPCIVKVREPVRETGAGMQQGCGRPPRHSRITVGGAGDHALEQTEHATHRGLSIQGGDKMHLGGAGVGEADIDTVGEKYVAQPISAVHALLRTFLPVASHPEHSPQLSAIEAKAID